MKTCEEWRSVAGYEGFYQVSNLGRVKRIKMARGAGLNKILKPYLGNNHYFSVRLCKDGKPCNMRIHRLVAQAFIPNPENKAEIDHIDGNKLNNRVENLKWCSHCENVNNPITRHKVGHLGKTGRVSHKSKPIICIELNRLYWGSYEAARETRICQPTISGAVSGRYKMAGGFHWRYATEQEIETAYKMP